METLYGKIPGYIWDQDPLVYRKRGTAVHNLFAKQLLRARDAHFTQIREA